MLKASFERFKTKNHSNSFHLELVINRVLYIELIMQFLFRTHK